MQTLPRFDIMWDTDDKWDIKRNYGNPYSWGGGQYDQPVIFDFDGDGDNDVLIARNYDFRTLCCKPVLIVIIVPDVLCLSLTHTLHLWHAF